MLDRVVSWMTSEGTSARYIPSIAVSVVDKVLDKVLVASEMLFFCSRAVLHPAFELKSTSQMSLKVAAVVPRLNVGRLACVSWPLSDLRYSALSSRSYTPLYSIGMMCQRKVRAERQ